MILVLAHGLSGLLLTCASLLADDLLIDDDVWISLLHRSLPFPLLLLLLLLVRVLILLFFLFFRSRQGSWFIIVGHELAIISLRLLQLGWLIFSLFLRFSGCWLLTRVLLLGEDPIQILGTTFAVALYDKLQHHEFLFLF